jgi:hypothetical protein
MDRQVPHRLTIERKQHFTARPPKIYQGKTIMLLSLVVASHNRATVTKDNQIIKNNADIISTQTTVRTAPRRPAKAVGTNGLARIDDDDDDSGDDSQATDDGVVVCHEPASSLTYVSNILSLGSNTAKRSRSSGGTLVVCPTSLLGQWVQEAQDRIRALRVDENNTRPLTVTSYYGDNRDAHNLNAFDIVVTTYGVLASCHAVMNSVTKEPQHALFKMTWERCVLDEAHYIKNRSTAAARATHAVKSKFRWCMTGTPIQNNIEDLHSLIQFLKHAPWNTPAWWGNVIRGPHEKGDPLAVQRLRSVLADGPLMLRRTKDMQDVDGSKLVQDLPPKEVELVSIRRRRVSSSRMMCALFEFVGLLGRSEVDSCLHVHVC